MLTGLKPEESINRKVEDTLKEPREINSRVPSSVNRVVMRAMAVQPEIRFQSVDQFSKALQSGKEIRDAKREILFRRKRMAVRIAALLLLSLGVGVFCMYKYQNMAGGGALEEAELTVWFSYEEDQEEAKLLLQNMSAEFLEKNPAVTVELVAVAEGEYEGRLKEALEGGNGPDVFMSGCLAKEDYGLLADLGGMFELSLLNTGHYYFLEDYKTYFPSQKQIPLTFDVPVLYKNVLEWSEGDEATDNYEAFADQTASGYLGNVRSYREVQAALPGTYALSFPETGNLKGSFQNLWSVNGNIQGEKYKASLYLLCYFLSETAQDYLTVQNDDHLPLNRQALETYLEVNTDFDGLPRYIESVTFEGET